jgi:hypothetical protein
MAPAEGDMNERARPLWAGAEAGAIGYGGVAAVARATGMAKSDNLSTRQLGSFDQFLSVADKEPLGITLDNNRLRTTNFIKEDNQHQERIPGYPT